MKRKPTASDYALWTTLPMAHTSQIEGRLKMILDTTRRRTTPRRFLMLAAIAGAAALVPLAMLQPTAKAQNGSQAAQALAEDKGSIQISGITNAAVPENEWWDRSGKALPVPVINPNPLLMDREITVRPGQKALFLAFHLTKTMQNVPLLYDVAGTTLDGITMTSSGGKYVTTMRSIQMQNSKSLLLYGAAFPASLSQTDVRIGNFSGPWTAATIVHYPFQGKYTIANTRGSRFSSIQLSLSGGKIMFSANMKTPDDFQNLRISAIDRLGHILLLHLTFIESRGSREQVIEDLPQPLSRLKDIRVETRPIAWTEFKDVALEPVKP